MLHSFHLAELPPSVSVRALVRRPSTPGLKHTEPLALMRLGAPVVTPDRLQLRRLAVFCSWEEEAALDGFLAEDPLGVRLATGWHVRLEYLRRWGHVEAFGDLPVTAVPTDLDEPAVAFTLARMRLPRVPRFVHWGRPVERLVRDHPDVTYATAATRPPHTVATFSVWRTARAMTDMVFGRGQGPAPRRHVDAMAERERRDFHHEFTTLRFRPLSEQGTWEGRTTLLS